MSTLALPLHIIHGIVIEPQLLCELPSCSNPFFRLMLREIRQLYEGPPLVEVCMIG